MRVLLFSPTGKIGTRLAVFLKNTDHAVKYMDRNGCDLDENEPIDVCIYSANTSPSVDVQCAKMVEDNCCAAVRLIRFLKQHNTKRIIYLSSDSVYGTLVTDQLTTESDKRNPSSYAMTKLLTEKIIEESGIPFFILRLPGVVHESWNGRTYLDRVISDMKDNKTVLGWNLDKDFNNVVYADDLCRFVLFLLERVHDSENRVLHLGQTKCISLMELLLYIKSRLGSSSVIKKCSSAGNRYFVLPTQEAEALGYSSIGSFAIVDKLCGFMDC